MKTLERPESSPANAILFYFWVMMAVTVVVCVMIAGTLIYRQVQLQRIEQLTNDYHLASRVELQNIESELNDFERKHTENPVGETRRRFSTALFIINHHAQLVAAIQDRYQDPTFLAATQRLTFAIRMFSRVIDSHGEGLDWRSAINLSGVALIRCKQLRSLHASAYGEKKAQALRYSATGSFVGLISLMIAGGGTVMMLLFGFATNAVQRQVKAEKALAHRVMQVELQHHAATMLNEIESVELALQNVVEIICKMTGWPVGHACLPSKNDPSRLESADVWYLSDIARFSNFREVTQGMAYRAGDGLPGRIWQSGQAEWIADVQSDDDYSSQRSYLDLNLKSAFGFPIFLAGKTIAILEFFSHGEIETDKSLLWMIQDVGQQAGRVLARVLAAEAERRQHERVMEELSATKKELVLKTRMAAIGQMSAQVAHEMRNPLGVVSNAIYYLKRIIPKKHEKWSQYLHLMYDEVATCNKFISELLDITRGKMVERSMFDLPVLIRKVFARHRVPGSDVSSRIKLKVFCQPDPFEVFADKDQLAQVFDNLLKNSLEAIGGNHGIIEIRAVRDEQQDVITVRDSGSGIRDEDRASVFDFLFTTKPTGSGLGLPICRQIIERHGGSVEIIDIESSGTTFRICLPQVTASRSVPGSSFRGSVQQLASSG